MNDGVQAGLVQLGLAGLLVLAWYSGAWQVIVTELTAGVTGSSRRFAPTSGADVSLSAPAYAPPPAPTGLRLPNSPVIL